MHKDATKCFTAATAQDCVYALSKLSPLYKPKPKDPLDNTPLRKMYSTAWAYQTLDGLYRCDPLCIKVLIFLSTTMSLKISAFVGMV